MRERTIHSTRRTETTPDGVNIIAREFNALAPHPAPSQGGRLVPTRGVNKILIEAPDETGNGIVLYECDPCGKTFATAMSTRSHLVSHNSTNTAPDYDVKTMKTLVAIVTKYKTARVRGYCEKAAEELNTLGVTRRDGQPWHASGVSHAYNHWKDRPEVKRSRKTQAVPLVDGKPLPPPVNTTRAVKTAVKRAIDERRSREIELGVYPVDVGNVSWPNPSREQIIEMLRQLTRTLGSVTTVLNNVIPALSGLAEPTPPEQLEELRMKAAQYDAISAALRGLQNGG